MTCALFYHSETASEPRKALWEGVETAVLENTKFKKDAFNHRMVHDDFVRKNKKLRNRKRFRNLTFEVPYYNITRQTDI